MKALPSCSSLGCDQRVRSRSITTTKSTPVSTRTASAYGWSSAVGSLVAIASRTTGERATALATDTASSRALARMSLRASYVARASAVTTRTSTTISCRTSTWRATDCSWRGRVSTGTS